jgi:hypothetical protein
MRPSLELVLSRVEAVRLAAGEPVREIPLLAELGATGGAR